MVEVRPHDTLPRLVIILGLIDFVAGSEESGEIAIVDGPDHFWEHPRHDEQLVRERFRSAYRHDAVTLAMRSEIDDNPLDHGLVRVVAVQQSQPLLARVETIQTPEITFAEDPLDASDVPLEGLLNTLAPFAPTDTKAEIHILALGHGGDGFGKSDELLIGNPPSLLVIGAVESGELLPDGDFIWILLGKRELIVHELNEKRGSALSHPVRVDGVHPSERQARDRGRDHIARFFFERNGFGLDHDGSAS